MGPNAKDAIPALLKLLTDPEEGPRGISCYALGTIGPDATEALPALRDALNDPSQKVRQFAQTAIDRIQPFQRPFVVQPERLAGAWEVVTPSGTHGIFMPISTHAQGPVDRQIITNQSITVRVYHRKDGQETWGWYGDNGGVSSFFDGQRLRVVDLDVTFRPEAQRWLGIWSLDGQTQQVELARPRPAPGSAPNRLAGEWEGLPDPPPGRAATRLHVVQSSDGMLTAWMDRMLGVNDQRHGESLRIVPDSASVILELVRPGGGQYRFTGTLSADGTTLIGRWNGLNARESFRRVP
jgi:hypothetical protein